MDLYFQSEITDHEPVVVCCHAESQGVSVAKVCILSPDGAISDVAYETTAERLMHNCLIARATGYIPFTFTLGVKGDTLVF